MLCENCNKRMATVHFTQIINNNKVQMNLCESCAQEKKQLNFGSAININDFLSGIMGFTDTGARKYPNAVQQPVVCGKCGMSYEDFQKMGKLGCNDCYESFGEKLNPLIRRLHGSVQHNGKVPAKISKNMKVTKEIDQLKKMLEQSIKNEEYEKAAQIRDQIRSMETENE